MISSISCVVLSFFMVSAQASEVEIKEQDTVYTEYSVQKGGAIYSRHPEFDGKAIELIKSGEVNLPEALDDIKQSRRFQAWKEVSGVDISTLRWLDLRDLEVASAVTQFEPTETVLHIPLVWSLRYDQSALSQGTVHVGGMLVVKINQNGRLVSLAVEQFTDSQWLEKVGRKIGLISRYDGAFARAVSIPLLKKFFAQPKNLNETLRLAGVDAQIKGGQLTRP